MSVAMDGVSPPILPAAPESSEASAQALPPRQAPVLSLIVPTFNERHNVPILVERLSQVLASCDWEVLFVDDNSPDGTAAVVREIRERDARVRCLRRIGRRGLAGACLERMLGSPANYLAARDADLRHDEAVLSAMWQRSREPCAAGGKDVHLVVESRYLGGIS